MRALISKIWQEQLSFGAGYVDPTMGAAGLGNAGIKP